MKKKEPIKVGDYVLITKPEAIITGDTFFIKGKGKIARIYYIRNGGYLVKFVENIGRVCNLYMESEFKKLNEIEAFMELL